MIESRYSIEYVETDSNRKKPSHFLSSFKFILISLLLSAVGLFAYSTITGASIQTILQKPISLAETTLKKVKSFTTNSVAIAEEDDTEDSGSNEMERKQIASAAKEKAEKLNNEITAQKEQIDLLKTEKKEIKNQLSSLLEKNTQQTNFSEKQTANNKNLAHKLEAIKKQLELEQKKSQDLTDQLTIQQLENETLSSLLNKSKDEPVKSDKNKSVAIEKPKEVVKIKSAPTPQKKPSVDKKEIIKALAPQNEPLADKKETLKAPVAAIEETKITETSTSIEKITAAIESAKKEKEAEAEEKQGQIVVIKETEKKEEEPPAKTSDNKEQKNDNPVNSDVDAIVKAMQGATNKQDASN